MYPTGAIWLPPMKEPPGPGLQPHGPARPLPTCASLLAEVMYPHIEQAAEVGVEEAERFLIEGFELAPSYLARLRAGSGRPRSADASWGTARSRSRTSPAIGDPSRSTAAPPARSCARPPPGSDGGAGSCVTSVVTPAWRTWTWVRSALRPPCAKPGACCLGAVESPGSVGGSSFAAASAELQATPAGTPAVVGEPHGRQAACRR
jgi:hypothetical protein